MLWCWRRTGGWVLDTGQAGRVAPIPPLSCACACACACTSVSLYALRISCVLISYRDSLTLAVDPCRSELK